MNMPTSEPKPDIILMSFIPPATSDELEALYTARPKLLFVLNPPPEMPPDIISFETLT